MIAIIDYGVGNLFSIQSSLQNLGIESCISNKQEELTTAHALILPGVGAYGDAIAKLRSSGLDQTIIEQAQRNKPILGICLGMQLLFDVGYEYGEHKGLGLVSGTVKDLKPILPPQLKVPHIGWNQLQVKHHDTLSSSIKNGDWVYYVHSYYVDCPKELIHSSSNYGIEIPGIIRQKNIVGMQFHPEKSSKVGLALLASFAQL